MEDHHETLTRPHSNNHKGLALCLDATLGIKAHRWVPARTPTVHRCPREGRGWPTTRSTVRQTCTTKKKGRHHCLQQRTSFCCFLKRFCFLLFFLSLVLYLLLVFFFLVFFFSCSFCGGFCFVFLVLPPSPPLPSSPPTGRHFFIRPPPVRLLSVGTHLRWTDKNFASFSSFSQNESREAQTRILGGPWPEPRPHFHGETPKLAAGEGEKTQHFGFVSTFWPRTGPHFSPHDVLAFGGPPLWTRLVLPLVTVRPLLPRPSSPSPLHPS